MYLSLNYQIINILSFILNSDTAEQQEHSTRIGIENPLKK